MLVKALRGDSVATATVATIAATAAVVIVAGIGIHTRLDVAAARLHLGTQLIEGKLVSITVLKNLLLGRAITREDITLNLRKIIRNDRGAITETAIAEETTAIESQEDQDNLEEASATPRIMTIVILESLHHKNITQFCHC